MIYADFDGPVISALRRAIAEVKQRWSVIGWVTKKILSRAPPRLRRYFKPLVPAVFAIVSTHQPALGPCGVVLVVLISSSYPYPTKWGRYNMFSTCCDKNSAFIFSNGHLPDVNPP
jgi:hypothetical protein